MSTEHETGDSTIELRRIVAELGRLNCNIEAFIKHMATPSYVIQESPLSEEDLQKLLEDPGAMQWVDSPRQELKPYTVSFEVADETDLGDG